MAIIIPLHPKYLVRMIIQECFLQLLLVCRCVNISSCTSMLRWAHSGIFHGRFAVVKSKIPWLMTVGTDSSNIYGSQQHPLSLPAWMTHKIRSQAFPLKGTSTYCWWKKSCTCYLWNPPKEENISISTGDRRIPSASIFLETPRNASYSSRDSLAFLEDLAQCDEKAHTGHGQVALVKSEIGFFCSFPPFFSRDYDARVRFVLVLEVLLICTLFFVL